MTRTICGVDISSTSLEARIGQEGAFGSFPNNGEGISALASFCQAHQVDLVAMEATGGYEQRAFADLSTQKLVGGHPCISKRSASSREDVEGGTDFSVPHGRTAPVHPEVFYHRRSAQGPLPKSRTTEQSHDIQSHLQGRLP